MYGVVLALKGDAVQLVGVKEAVGFLVVDEGVVLPAIPQAFDDLHVLMGFLVALGMRQLLR